MKTAKKSEATLELSAIDTIDKALSNAKAMLIVLRDGLDAPMNKGEEVPYGAESLHNTLGVIVDLLNNIDDATRILDKSRER